jgi:hypothetical protein
MWSLNKIYNILIADLTFPGHTLIDEVVMAVENDSNKKFNI